MTAVMERNGTLNGKSRTVRPSIPTGPKALPSNWTPPNGSGTVLCLLTPELAKNMLGMIGRQRPRMERLVRRIAEDIRAGRWVYDGSPIVFDTTGSLVNGQHRVAAIAESGTPVQVRVEWGVSPEAFSVMDGGITRQNRDVLAIEGFTNPAALASCLKLVRRWNPETGLSPQRVYSNKEVVDLVHLHPEVVQCVDFVFSNRDLKRLQSPSVSAFLLWVLRPLDRQRADTFMSEVALGANLPAGDPRFIYRRWIENGRDRYTATSHSAPKLIAGGIRAWNAYRLGTPIQLITFRTTDEFPIPV